MKMWATPTRCMITALSCCLCLMCTASVQANATCLVLNIYLAKLQRGRAGQLITSSSFAGMVRKGDFWQDPLHE